ncbi:MAG: insulinase family protein [Pseudomonadota bacterium]
MKARESVIKKLLFTLLLLPLLKLTAYAQEVIPLDELHGLHSAYVIPMPDTGRIDVQVIVLSGGYDEGDISGIAHYTEHLAALHSDTTVLREPRQRDLNAFTSNVSTVYTNSGGFGELDQIMQLARAVLDKPSLPDKFSRTEIDIVKREVFYKERNSPFRFLQRKTLQNLYGSDTGRADNDVQDLDLLTYEKGLEFHAEHYRASNVMVILSGAITPELAQEKLTEYFGDTTRSTQVPDIWLDQHPAEGLRAIEKVKTDRIVEDTIFFAKFFEFPEPQDILALQASFFIASDIYNGYLNDALYIDSFVAQSINMGSYIAVDGDLEFWMMVVPSEGVTLEEGLAAIEDAIAGIRNAEITPEQIETARAKNTAYTRELQGSARARLDFFQNFGSDGLPPSSPSQFADFIEAAPDEEILFIINAFAAASPMAATLAEAIDP